MCKYNSHLLRHAHNKQFKNSEFSQLNQFTSTFLRICLNDGRGAPDGAAVESFPDLPPPKLSYIAPPLGALASSVKIRVRVGVMQ